MPARQLKSIVRSTLYPMGIMRAARALKRKKFRILNYHRFPEDRSHLIAQCEYIRRYYQPVSMRSIAENLRTGAPLPNHAVAVTVDDGYRDFLLHAHPVFLMYEIPATMFVVTDVLDGRRWLYFDQLTYMFDRTRCPSVQFAGGVLDIASDRKRARSSVAVAVKLMPNAERLWELDRLRRELGVELPNQPPAEYAALSWTEVRMLASTGVEFGSHTRTHPILSSISHPAELHSEIAGSKQRLDQELGFPSLHFAYPNGTWADFNQETLAVVRSCKYATAVTAVSGFNVAGSDPFQLFRLTVEPTFSERYFSELLTGLRRY